jgi:aminomethyltransferase
VATLRSSIEYNGAIQILNGIIETAAFCAVVFYFLHAYCSAIFAGMKETAFTKNHIALGAKMAEFAGYNMPISYTGINDEHAAVRSNAGIFDVSHMGEFILKGPQALDLIQRVTTNDASRLTDGKAQYSSLTNHNGGIVDDLIVYCLEENKAYMLVVNASNIEKDWAWIASHNTEDADMHNISDKTCLLAIQGPNACRMLQPLADTDIMNLKYYTFVKGKFGGVENVLISATGYTGAGGVEIYFENKNDDAQKIWNAIFEIGTPQNLKPIGLGARDTLRLEMGYCLYGNDIDDSTSPLEAGLGWITKLNKDSDFTSKDFLVKQKAEGIKRKLIGFEMIDRGIPRHDYLIKDIEGNKIGKVTSGTQSPSLGKAIGLGYVDIANAANDSEIFIEIRNNPVKAKVVKLPFV